LAIALLLRLFRETGEATLRSEAPTKAPADGTS
jgi:hypothetical protein